MIQQGWLYYIFVSSLFVPPLNLTLTNQDMDYDNSFLEDIPNEHVGNDNLSGGQQFRMVLMRTLLTDAKIILIDNNFMSVDSKLREKIFEYLKKSGKTIIFTDHLYRNEYKEFSVIEV